jgi:predicted nucleotidyltransferase component of viral defense system
MKPLLIERLREQSDAFSRRSVTREFLQARILLSLQDHGAFSNWAFVSGTALRFLYNLPRYSEDLDFSLTAPGEAQFEKLMRALRGDLQAESYNVEIKVRANKTVNSAMVKFRGLLHEVGISPLPDETIAVKIEIDTHPPQGAATSTKAVRRYFLLNLQHYDAASLLSGKLHAILSRKYTKGRDLYDLAWYLADPNWPQPNIPLLVNSLRQTAWSGNELSELNWRQIIVEKLKTIDWQSALKDVSPFLERPEDAAWISPERLLLLLK